MTDVYTETYPSGATLCRIVYERREGSCPGRLNGPFQIFYENGKVLMNGIWLNGHLESLFQWTTEGVLLKAYEPSPRKN